MAPAASTVDAGEVERFSRLSHAWWDPRGEFAPLHRINPLRIGYIRDQAAAHFQRSGELPLSGLSLIDIGCGGGMVAEPLARLGANVTGIDASQKNIEAAKIHAGASGLAIDYRAAAAETVAASGETFDIVLALEIIEHVADIGAFVAAAARLTKPGGLIIFSTINRTAKAYALAVVGAEYVLRMIPRGTHDWKKFVKPSELAAEWRRHGIEMKDMTGMVMNPLTWAWELSPRDVDVNYLMAGTRAP